MGRVAGVTPEETRRRLLDAAAEVFERQGYEGTRVADIAAGASVSNGALYGHFRSKTDLLAAALIDRGSADLASLFESAPEQSIVAPLAEIGRDLASSPPAKGALMVEALVAARRDPEVAEMMSFGLADRLDWLAGRIRAGQKDGTIGSGISADALSRFCAMLLFGSILMAGADLPKIGDGEWSDLIDALVASLADC